MKQFSIRVTDETYDKLVSASTRLGVGRSALVSMAISAGLGNIIRATFPEDALSPEMWAKITAEMVKTGQPVKLPDGTVVGSEDK